MTHDKKLRKKAQLQHNLKHRLFFLHISRVLADAETAALIAHGKRAEAKRGEKNAAASKEIWSARTQTIRNKLDNSRRQAEDRWNRFAGTTESAGGMGR